MQKRRAFFYWRPPISEIATDFGSAGRPPVTTLKVSWWRVAVSGASSGHSYQCQPASRRRAGSAFPQHQLHRLPLPRLGKAHSPSSSPRRTNPLASGNRFSTAAAIIPR